MLPCVWVCTLIFVIWCWSQYIRSVGDQAFRVAGSGLVADVTSAPSLPNLPVLWLTWHLLRRYQPSAAIMNIFVSSFVSSVDFDFSVVLENLYSSPTKIYNAMFSVIFMIDILKTVLTVRNVSSLILHDSFVCRIHWRFDSTHSWYFIWAWWAEWVNLSL